MTSFSRRAHGPLPAQTLPTGTDGDLADYVGLQQEIDAIAAANADRYQALVAAGDLHPRLRFDQLYLERFNLRATDAVLVREVDRAAAGKPDAVPADVAFANYVRFLFLPHHMYTCM